MKNASSKCLYELFMPQHIDLLQRNTGVTRIPLDIPSDILSYKITIFRINLTFRQH